MKSSGFYQAITRMGSLSWTCTFVKDFGVRDFDQLEMSCQTSFAAKIIDQICINKNAYKNK